MTSRTRANTYQWRVDYDATPVSEQCLGHRHHYTRSNHDKPRRGKLKILWTTEEIVRQVPINDKLVIAGDFNAGAGREVESWPGVIGPYGIGKSNTNGELLLAFCSDYNLFLMNKVFNHRPHHKTTWMHPRSRHWHLLDYVITRQRSEWGTGC